MESLINLINQFYSAKPQRHNSKPYYYYNMVKLGHWFVRERLLVGLCTNNQPTNELRE